MSTSVCRTDVERFCARLPDVVGGLGNGHDVVVVTRAPAVVDVIGGLVEDGGGSVILGPLDVAVAAAAAGRRDRRLALCRLGGETRVERSVPIAALEPTAPAAAAQETLGDVLFDAPATRAVLRLLRDLWESGGAARMRDGLSIVVQSDWPADAPFDLAGSLLAAVVEAAAEFIGLGIDASAKALLCRSAARAGGCAAPGVRVPLSALLAEAGGLLFVRAHPTPTPTPMELPEGLTVAVLDTQLRRPVAAQRYIETSVAAAMGHRMIVDLIRRDGQAVELDGAVLTNVAPPDFVRRFRNRLPTRLAGRVFLERFGDPSAAAGPVDPDTVYKVRSRAEHFIYENRRVTEFANTLARCRRTHDPADLAHAGELWFASHWSHSQRCGIGSVETDLIAGAVRRLGPENGFFGAKVTGFGSGGGMVVLMKDTPEHQARLKGALSEVQTKTGGAIRTFAGAAAGASRVGPRRLESVLTAAGG